MTINIQLSQLNNIIYDYKKLFKFIIKYNKFDFIFFSCANVIVNLLNILLFILYGFNMSNVIYLIFISIVLLIANIFFMINMKKYYKKYTLEELTNNIIDKIVKYSYKKVYMSSELYYYINTRIAIFGVEFIMLNNYKWNEYTFHLKSELINNISDLYD